MTLSPKLQALKELCAKATPGPWINHGITIIGHGFELATVNWHSGHDHEIPNAEYIATFNPEVVSAMIQVVEALDAMYHRIPFAMPIHEIRDEMLKRDAAILAALKALTDAMEKKP